MTHAAGYQRCGRSLAVLIEAQRERPIERRDDLDRVVRVTIGIASRPAIEHRTRNHRQHPLPRRERHRWNTRHRNDDHPSAVDTQSCSNSIKGQTGDQIDPATSIPRTYRVMAGRSAEAPTAVAGWRTQCPPGAPSAGTRHQLAGGPFCFINSIGSVTSFDQRLVVRVPHVLAVRAGRAHRRSSQR